MAIFIGSLFVKNLKIVDNRIINTCIIYVHETFYLSNIVSVFFLFKDVLP